MGSSRSINLYTCQSNAFVAKFASINIYCNERISLEDMARRVPDINSRDPPRQFTYACSECCGDYTTTREDTLRVHVANCNGPTPTATGEFVCNVCDKVLKNRKVLALHYSNEHQWVTQTCPHVDCKDSDITYATHTLFAKHQASHRPSTSAVCPVAFTDAVPCKGTKVYVNWRGLKQHLQIVHKMSQEDLDVHHARVKPVQSSVDCMLSSVPVLIQRRG